MSHTRKFRTAAIAVAAAGAMLLSACSSGGEGNNGGETADTSKLVIALDADQAPLGYDPIRYGVGQRLFFEGVYDTLFTTDTEGNTVPNVVSNFEYNDDNTELTLDLASDHTFADGSGITAEIVKDNLDARGDGTLDAYKEFAAGGNLEIADVTVVDEDTVTLKFAKGQPGFEANLTFPGGALVGPTGLADRKALGAAADGSGPLQIDDKGTTKGTSYLQTKKDGHAGAANFAFDSYEFRPIVDPQARVNSLSSGEVDVAYLAASTVPQVESAGKAVSSNGGTIRNLIAFDKAGATNPAFADPRVFQALSRSIDRDAYVAAVHPGEVPTWNALPADSPGFIPELEKEFSYDPEAAKQLLKEAGFENLSFDFTITPDSQRDIEAIQPFFAAIGVDMKLKNASSTEEAFAAVKTEPLGGPIPFTWQNPAGNVFGALMGFANPHGAKNPAIEGATGAYLGAAGAGNAEGKAAALTDLNRAIVEAGWLIPLFEQQAPWGYDQGKVSSPVFVGPDAFPLLSGFSAAK